MRVNVRRQCCRVWDIGTGEEVHMMEAHSSNVLCLKYHGDVMVTGSKVRVVAVSTSCQHRRSDGLILVAG